MCPINNEPALDQVMAWRRSGDKPLPDPMMTKYTILNEKIRLVNAI